MSTEAIESKKQGPLETVYRMRLDDKGILIGFAGAFEFSIARGVVVRLHHERNRYNLAKEKNPPSQSEVSVARRVWGDRPPVGVVAVSGLNESTMMAGSLLSRSDEFARILNQQNSQHQFGADAMTTVGLLLTLGAVSLAHATRRLKNRT